MVDFYKAHNVGINTVRQVAPSSPGMFGCDEERSHVDSNHPRVFKYHTLFVSEVFNVFFTCS